MVFHLIQNMLNGEKVFSVMVKLDRCVSNGKVNPSDLKECLSSDMMYPHVLAVLQAVGHLADDGDDGQDLVSSTNVRILHGIYRALHKDTLINRQKWLQHVAQAVKQMFLDDLEATRSQAKREWIQAVVQEVNSASVAWNMCKLVTVLQCSAGSVTKLRRNRNSCVLLKDSIVQKITAKRRRVR